MSTMLLSLYPRLMRKLNEIDMFLNGFKIFYEQLNIVHAFEVQY